MEKGTSLYHKVVAITADYLGPAAERFIDRQVQNHLQKDPADLVTADLDTLIDWLRISFAFITNDRSIIDELTSRLTSLTPSIRLQDK